MDTFGHLLALHVMPADADDRAEVGRLAQAVQAATGNSVELGYVDQGYTGERPAEAARVHGIALEVMKLPEAKRGFVLLPRRLARDYEHLPRTLAGLHLVAFATLMLAKTIAAFDLVRHTLQVCDLRSPRPEHARVVTTSCHVLKR